MDCTKWSSERDHVCGTTIGNFENEYCEDGIVKIIFVKSQDNNSDIMMKNLASKLHKKHSAKLVESNPMIETINYEER